MLAKLFSIRSGELKHFQIRHRQKNIFPLFFRLPQEVAENPNSWKTAKSEVKLFWTVFAWKFFVGGKKNKQTEDGFFCSA